MRRLYTLAAYLLAPAYCAALLSRGFKERGYWQRFGERLGFGAPVASAVGGAAAPGGTLWLHASSAGEVQAASALAAALRRRCPGLPLVITTATPAGAARARALLAKDGAVAGDVRFAPLDLPGAVRRFFDRARPRLGVVIETELWPNLFHECRRRGIPLALASARLSERSARRYGRLRRLFGPTLDCCSLIAAQSEPDAGRFRRIGAPCGRLHVVGNVKFDLEVPAQVMARGRALRERYAPGRPAWVAGSTHEGEEQAALEAHAIVRRTHPDALLILAPRHPPRFAEVAARLERLEVAFVRRSREAAGVSGAEASSAGSSRAESSTAESSSAESSGAGAAPHVLLLDTLGELLDFYAAADVVFVGGSLVPIGGHNLLEPAALGRPILTGPHHFNSPQIAELLLARDAMETVRDARELGERAAQLLSSAPEREAMGARARAAVEQNRGAIERLLALIEPLLSQERIAR